MADEKPNGLFITDDEGNVYYLRPEILAQAKMPEEDLKLLREEMAASGKTSAKSGELNIDDLHSVAGGISIPMLHLGSFRLPSFGSAAHLSANVLNRPNFQLPSSAMSTVMCPW